jgi:hypothetical protein
LWYGDVLLLETGHRLPACSTLLAAADEAGLQVYTLLEGLEPGLQEPFNAFMGVCPCPDWAALHACQAASALPASYCMRCMLRSLGHAYLYLETSRSLDPAGAPAFPECCMWSSLPACLPACLPARPPADGFVPAFVRGVTQAVLDVAYAAPTAAESVIAGFNRRRRRNLLQGNSRAAGTSSRHTRPGP